MAAFRSGHAAVMNADVNIGAESGGGYAFRPSRLGAAVSRGCRCPTLPREEPEKSQISGGIG
jgi:hypothetical protein